jgi:hypothetical protein
VTDTLGVAVNKNGLHTLEVPDTYEVGGPFVVELRNHGEAVHVHLNLDDRLSEVARIGATNHYVEAEEARHVDIEVLDPEAWPTDVVRGKLKVVAAHGQETYYVDVVLDRREEETPVEVDPDLNRPQEGEEIGASPSLRALPVGVLGAIALLLAVGAIFAGDSFNFALGLFSVIAGGLCALAAYYLLS